MTSTLRKLCALLLLISSLLTLLFIFKDQEKTTLNPTLRAQHGDSYIQLSQGITHYQLSGPTSGPLVVLVHGFSVPKFLWQPSIQDLVAAGQQVLAFDLYGRGLSDRPASDYCLDLYVQQLHELLVALELEQPFHLVGLSMGGPISVRYSHRYPQQVAALTLIAPLLETPSSGQVNALALPGLGEYLANVVMIPRLQNNLDSIVANPDAYPQWSEQFNRQTQYHGYRRAMLASVRYLAGKSFAEDYQQLAQHPIPTQLIWGTEDQTLPYQGHPAILALLPQAVLHTIPEVGHLPQYEAPASVSPLLIQHHQQAQDAH